MKNNLFKVVRNLFLTTTLFTTSLVALDFAQFQKQNNAQYSAYKKTIQEEFKEYKKAYDIEFKSYKNNILKNWDKPEVSTNHKWVQYDKNYKTKKVVDFKNQNINLEVIAKTEKEAKKQIIKLLDTLLKENTKTAFKNDILENKIYKRLNKPKPKIIKKQPIVKDIISKKTKQKYLKVIRNKTLQKVKKRNKFIYKVTFKMPPNSLMKKAKRYIKDVKINGRKQKIDPELIYAIMHSESSFNPMARSHIPAYGLMQIVPRSAGIDSYYFLYGKKKVLPSSYLYDAKNNIKVGSAYLHILYYKYLKHIKNPTNKLLCTIAAYNTGAGNVAKTFIGNNNIKKAAKVINKMTPKQVYKRLMRNLPYNETKKYLKKVYDRTFIYEKLLKKKLR